MADVMTPNSDILIDGLRLDQIYTRAKAREDERNGIVRSGEMTCRFNQYHFTKDLNGSFLAVPTKRNDAQRARRKT